MLRKHAALDASLLQVCRSSFCLFVHTNKAQSYWLCPPPSFFSLHSPKTLWLFSTFKSKHSCATKVSRKTCVEPIQIHIYCDDTECYKLFPAISPLHIHRMDMGPTCSITSGNVCSLSLPAPSPCCVLSALLTLCQILKRDGWGGAEPEISELITPSFLLFKSVASALQM